MPFPAPVKQAYVIGIADALTRYGMKKAAEEIRLQIPNRKFHGWEAAFKAKDERSGKKANEAPTQSQPPAHASPNDGTADGLEKLLEQIDIPSATNPQLLSRDPLDRSTAWSTPSNLAAGDTASRMSDMGQNTSFGGI